MPKYRITRSKRTRVRRNIKITAFGKQGRARLTIPFMSSYTTFLKSVGTITASAGGVLNPYYDDNASGTTDWTSFSNLFDQYRILAMKVSFIPSVSNDDSSITKWAPMYILFDPDNTGVGPSTPDTCLQYDQCKVVNMSKPFSFYHRIPRITSTAGSASVIHAGGWRDIATPDATCGIKMYSEGLTASKLYGNIITKFYVQFRHRR